MTASPRFHCHFRCHVDRHVRLVRTAIIAACPSIAAALVMVCGMALSERAHAALGTTDDPASVRAALDAATRGPHSEFERLSALLAEHPLRVWIDYAELHGRLDRAEESSVSAFLDRYPDQPASELLRTAWLQQRLARSDWSGFLRNYRGSDRLDLRCGHVLARLRTGATTAATAVGSAANGSAARESTAADFDWSAEVEALWLHGRSMPNACDAPFAELAARGRLDDALRWQRFDLAAEAGQPGLMRFLAGSLTETARTRALDYVRFLEQPDSAVGAWPRDARSRRIAVLGLTRLARRDPDRAESLSAEIAPALQLDADATGQIAHAIALWSAAGYRPETARRMAAVPRPQQDDQLLRWRLREALAREHDADALAALLAVPAEQRATGSRWRYYEARLRERAGEHEAARALYADAARHADFFGFLAADRIDRPYALCPLSPSDDDRLRQRMAAHPGLARALALFDLDRPGWAELEWRAALTGLTDAERIEAVRLARAAGWYDRALFALDRHPDELRYYRLRFPLPFPRTIREHAERHELDPAWLAAQIRAESAWMPQARSSADARGLMQILPGTGRDLARTLGLPWPGSAALDRPLFNITLGSAYLRQQLDAFGGRPHLAIAAYNAGPTPVRRWQAARGGLDPDLFIETIPFHETRDYVARVLAFAVIYDWRLHDRAVPISERLAGKVPARPTRAIVCPSPESTATP